jgi:hypothetical protein
MKRRNHEARIRTVCDKYDSNRVPKAVVADRPRSGEGRTRDKPRFC